MTREALYYAFYYVIARYIPRPLIESRRLYETGRNLRQYGMYIASAFFLVLCFTHICKYTSIIISSTSSTFERPLAKI